MPSLDDLGTKQVISGTPAPEDLIPYFDVSEFGNAPVKRTTVSSLLSGAGGTADNISTSDGSSAAAAGALGEYLESVVAVGASVVLVSSTPKNVTSLALTAGDWDVEGVVSFFGLTSGALSVVSRIASVSLVSNTHAENGYQSSSSIASTADGAESLPLTRRRVRVSSTTTLYLVGSATFSGGTVDAYGAITARRVR